MVKHIRIIAILVIFFLLIPPQAVLAVVTDTIWVQETVYKGTDTSVPQSWAYYPYYGSNMSLNNWSARNNGTAYFNVTPGTTIWRKVFVKNMGNNNVTLGSVMVTGLPASWKVTVTPPGMIPAQGRWSGNVTITVPANATPGNYNYTVTATTRNGTTSSITDTVRVVARVNVTPTASPTPTPRVTPTPAPRTTATPTPKANPGTNSGYVLYEGFENGINTNKWIGSAGSNFKDNMIITDSTRAHTGRFSARGLAHEDNIYARAARNVPYGGNGFELTAWFYVNLSEPGYRDPYHSNAVGYDVYNGTSEWVGVVNVTADPTNRGAIDSNKKYRVVGYNNRTNDKMLMYHYWDYKDFAQPGESGWYMGKITYDNMNFTFTMYNAKGIQIGTTHVLYDPGYQPKAIIMNAGSQYHMIDDITYKTW